MPEWVQVVLYVLGTLGTLFGGGALGKWLLDAYRERRAGKSEARKDAIAELYAMLDRKGQDITRLEDRVDRLTEANQRCLVSEAQLKERVANLEKMLEENGIRHKDDSGTHRPPDRRNGHDPDYKGPFRRRTDPPTSPPEGERGERGNR